MTRPQPPLKNLFRCLSYAASMASVLLVCTSALGQRASGDSRAPVTGPDKQAVERMALEEMTEADIERVNGEPLIARQPLPKSNKLIKPTGYDARLIVKFMDDMKARPLDDGMIFSRSRQSTFEVDVIARRYGAVFSSPFRKLNEGDLNRLRARAALHSGKAQPDLAGMMYIEAPDGFMEPLAKELQALDCVEWIAFETKPEPHGYVNTSPPAATLAASTMAPLGGLPGACCVGSGCISVTQTECDSIGGNFRGEGIACGANTCLGACCFPLGDGRDCDVLTNAECDTEGGVFNQNTIGGGQAACIDACLGRGCAFDGECEDNAISSDYPQADFLLGGTCALDPCPPPPGVGACCLPSDEPLEEAECVESTAGACTQAQAVFVPGLTCDEAICDTGACTPDFLDANATVTVTTLAECVGLYDPVNAPNPSFAGFGHGSNTILFDLQRDGLWGSCCIGGNSCLIVAGTDEETAIEACLAIGDELQVSTFWAPPEFDNINQEFRRTTCTFDDAQAPPQPISRCGQPGICAIVGQGCDPTLNLATCVTGLGGVFIEYRDPFGIFPPLPPCPEPLSSLSDLGFEAVFGTCCNQDPRVDPSNVVDAGGTTGGCVDQANPIFGNPLTGFVQPYFVYIDGDELPAGIPKAVCDSLGYPWELIFTAAQTECQPGNLTCDWTSGNFPCGYDLVWASWTDLPATGAWPRPGATIRPTPSQRYQGPCHQALTFYNCWDYEDTTTPGVECCDTVVGLYAGCGGDDLGGSAITTTWNLFCSSLAMTVCGPTNGPSIDPLFDPFNDPSPCPVVYAGLGLTRPDSINKWGYCPCIGSILAGPCELPNGTKGCEDPQCCTTVCQLEGYGYCCGAGWDAGCAEIASIMCSRTREDDDVQLYQAIPRCNDPMCADYDTPDFTEGQGYLTPIPYGYRKDFYGGQISCDDIPILAFPTPTVAQPQDGGFLPACSAFPSGIPGYMGQGLYLQEWRKKNIDPFWYKWAGLYGIGAEYQQEYDRDLASTDGTIYNRTRGLGVRVGVIDYSYTEMHEDLNVTLEPDVTMQILPEPYGPSHGTAVLGIINAIDQTRPFPGLPDSQQPDGLEQIGVVGIAPEAEAYFFPLVTVEDGPRELEAWTNAINTLSLGDVLCIPYGPDAAGGCANSVEPLWQLAQVATDSGITVIMSAGNAGVDLSQSPEFGDNGTIVTAASTPGGAVSGAAEPLPPWNPDVTEGAIPLYFSNFNITAPDGGGDPTADIPGNQISLNMWGRNVYTTGGISPPVNLDFNETYSFTPPGLDCFDPVDNPCFDPNNPYPNPPNWNPAQKAESNVAYGTRIMERAYTNDFGGTSASAAMVAAVTCGIQGFHNQYYGIDASPQQIRAALCGTALGNGDPLITTAPEGQFYGFGTPRPRDACLSLITQSGLAYDDSPWLDDLYILTGDYVSGNIFSVKGQGDSNYLVIRTVRARGDVSTGQPYPFDEVTYPVRGPVTDIGVVVDSDANRFSSVDVTISVKAPNVRTAFFGYAWNPNVDRWEYIPGSFTFIGVPAEDDGEPVDDEEEISFAIDRANSYIEDGDLKVRFWTYQVEFGGNGLSTSPFGPSSDDPHPSDYSLLRYEFIGFEIETGGLGDGDGSILNPIGGNGGGGGGSGQPLGG